MLKKLCDNCEKFSYSSSSMGKWLCPTCGNDLTHNRIMELQERDIVKKSNVYTLNFKKA